MAIVPVVTISLQPLDQSVSVGGTATFSVVSTVSDDGVIFYQWITNNPRFVSAVVNVNKPGVNGVSTGSSQGVYDLGVGSQYDSLYSNIPLFVSTSGYAQPGGLIPGATSSSYTTPIVQSSDNGCQLSCYVVQVRTIAQSVGNLPNFQLGSPNPAPFTKPMRLFGTVSTRAAILTVH